MDRADKAEQQKGKVKLGRTNRKGQQRKERVKQDNTYSKG